jgi:release factor glutamine methyltransferase
VIDTLSPATVLDYVNWASDYLEARNIIQPRRNAEVILEKNCGLSKTEIYLKAKEKMPDSWRKDFVSGVEKRSRGYPLQYLLGETEFSGLVFKVSEAVFIPRPETEILVEKSLELLRKRNSLSSRVLDIATGCGNIAVSLAKFFPQAKIYAADISSEAIKIARYNAGLNDVAGRIKFIQSDLFTSYELRVTSYDIIVSNPPYIPTFQLKNLPPEVKYEPHLALDGQEDGLFYIKKIISDSPQYLKKDGILVIEIGFGQVQAVRKFSEHSLYFKRIEIIKDYQGIERVVILYSL